MASRLLFALWCGDVSRLVMLVIGTVPKGHEIPGGVFASLHFRVYDSRVFTLSINVMNFCNKCTVGYCWVENMVHVDRKKLQKPLLASSGGRIDCWEEISTKFAYFTS